MSTRTRTICRCCAAGCGIVVEHEDERVLRVSGDDANRRTRGYICPKGASLPYFHHHPERLERARVAAEARGWQPCLDDLATRLMSVIEAHGADRVAVYQGTGTASDSLGMAAIRGFLQQIGSSQFYSAATVDVAPAFRAAEMVCGSWFLFPTWVPEDEQSRFGLLIGFNPVVSHGYLTLLPDAARRIREYRARGGKLWLLDPRHTKTAALMDRHLAIRPGSDALLLGWLIRALLAGGADTQDYERMTVAEDRVALAGALDALDDELVCARTGLPLEDLDAVLAEIRAAGRISVMCGTGVTLGEHALLTEWLKWVLLIVTGSLDRAGGMWFNPGCLNPLEQRTQWHHAPPGGDLQPGPRSRPELSRMFGENPSVAIVDEIEAGNIRALFVAGGSPLTAFPDPERLRRALAMLEVLAVVDIVETPLTRIATHVLPATGQLERADVVLETQTVYAPPVLAPAGERKPMWWIFAETARRLGLDTLEGQDAEAISDTELIRRMAIASRGGAEQLLQAGSDGITPPRVFGWVRQNALPDGCWRLLPPGMLERLDDLLHADTREERLLLVSARQLTNTNSTRYMSPAKSPDRPLLSIHPDDAASFGLANAAAVRISSDAGQINAAVLHNATLRRGVVTLTHGWYEANVAALTGTTKVDPLTGQPRMTAIPVRISREG